MMSTLFAVRGQDNELKVQTKKTRNIMRMVSRARGVVRVQLGWIMQRDNRRERDVIHCHSSQESW